MSDDPMTEAELTELARLAAAATPGPWEVADGGTFNMGRYVLDEYFVRLPNGDISIAADILEPDAGKPSKENAAFIAAARTAVPRLLADLARLTAERDDARGGLVLSNSAHAAVRRLLEEQGVPAAPFIDDHVGNAIVQRNNAVKRLEVAMELLRKAKPHLRWIVEYDVVILGDEIATFLAEAVE